MAPILPVGQGGFPFQRSGQNPASWNFSSELDDSNDNTEAPVAMPTVNMPRVSLQIQEMLSQPNEFNAVPHSSTASTSVASQYRLPLAGDDNSGDTPGTRQGVDRRVGDRRARSRDEAST